MKSCPRDARINIRYFVVPNGNKSKGGFMPMIAVNGRHYGDTYGRGYDRADAMARAHTDAWEEAARYTGDWCVKIKKGRPARRSR